MLRSATGVVVVIWLLLLASSSSLKAEEEQKRRGRRLVSPDGVDARRWPRLAGSPRRLLLVADSGWRSGRGGGR